MSFVLALVVLALGGANERTPADNAGCSTVYCPEQWCYRDGECKSGALSRPFFEAPTLRPLAPKRRMRFRPEPTE